MKDFEHIPVLLDEVISNLNIKEDGYYVDATVGGAGHSYHILKKLKSGHLYCFDQDKQAIEASDKHLSSLSYTNYTLIHSNFANISKELRIINPFLKINGILFDLGVSSFQLDEPSRGFSYRYDSPLDMRMNQDNNFSAYNVVNEYKESDLVKIFYEYGEEKYSRKIAHAICEARKIKKIETTFELVDIIKSVVPIKDQKLYGHPAKRVFQAIRIEVNQELTILKQALKDAVELLDVGGRCLVITFHSLEDRIVKQLFKELSTDNWHRGLPVENVSKIGYKLVFSKPILPTENELINNPRSHSAKLRIIEKI